MSDHRVDDENTDNDGEDPADASGVTWISRTALDSPSLKLLDVASLSGVEMRRVRYYRERGFLVSSGQVCGRGRHAKYSLRHVIKVLLLDLLGQDSLSESVDCLDSLEIVEGNVRLYVDGVWIDLPVDQIVNRLGDESTE